jgi:hypothetical protein
MLDQSVQLSIRVWYVILEIYVILEVFSIFIGKFKSGIQAYIGLHTINKIRFSSI